MGASAGHGRRPAGRSAGSVVGLALVAPPLVGSCCDIALGSGPGWGLLVGGVVGAVASIVLGARRKVLWWVAPLPALIVAALAAAVYLLTRPSSSGGGKAASTDLIRWAVAAFPAMATAQCAVLAVLAARGLKSLFDRSRNHA